MTEKFTERDSIEVQLRFISRVRSMQPSARALDALDRDEDCLRRRLRTMDAQPAVSGEKS